MCYTLVWKSYVHYHSHILHGYLDQRFSEDRATDLFASCILLLRETYEFVQTKRSLEIILLQISMTHFLFAEVSMRIPRTLFLPLL